MRLSQISVFGETSFAFPATLALEEKPGRTFVRFSRFFQSHARRKRSFRPNRVLGMALMPVFPQAFYQLVGEKKERRGEEIL
jgi:hypothetical protein